WPSWLNALIKAQLLSGRRNADFDSITIKRFEAGAFRVAKIVLDIIAQVTRAERAMLRRVLEVFARDGLRLTDPLVTCRVQRSDVVGSQPIGATRPEGPDKRQAGHRRPRLSKVDLLDVAFLARVLV